MLGSERERRRRQREKRRCIKELIGITLNLHMLPPLFHAPVLPWPGTRPASSLAPRPLVLYKALRGSFKDTNWSMSLPCFNPRLVPITFRTQYSSPWPYHLAGPAHVFTPASRFLTMPHTPVLLVLELAVLCRVPCSSVCHPWAFALECSAQSESHHWFCL